MKPRSLWSDLKRAEKLRKRACPFCGANHLTGSFPSRYACGRLTMAPQGNNRIDPFCLAKEDEITSGL